mgnify:CR=1 FL=1
MGKHAVSFEGSVTTTGRSEAVRLEKAFFRAHPEFRQKARVRAQAIGEGHVLVSVAEPLVPTSDEVDPVVSAYLSFLGADMVAHPESRCRTTTPSPTTSRSRVGAPAVDLRCHRVRLDHASCPAVSE